MVFNICIRSDNAWNSSRIPSAGSVRPDERDEVPREFHLLGSAMSPGSNDSDELLPDAPPDVLLVSNE